MLLFARQALVSASQDTQHAIAVAWSLPMASCCTTQGASNAMLEATTPHTHRMGRSFAFANIHSVQTDAISAGRAR